MHETYTTDVGSIYRGHDTLIVHFKGISRTRLIGFDHTTDLSVGCSTDVDVDTVTGKNTTTPSSTSTSGRLGEIEGFWTLGVVICHIQMEHSPPTSLAIAFVHWRIGDEAIAVLQGQAKVAVDIVG